MSDVELAMAPAATYERLVRTRTTGRAAALAGRLLLAVAILGTSVAIQATGRASVELTAVVGVSWSFTLLLQALAAAAIILPARARPVTRLRAFELWFQAHVPWSLWLLLPALVALVMDHKMSDTWLVITALIPAAWTAVLLRAFARQVLLVRHFAVAMAVHQCILWGLALCYVAYAAGGWDRLFAEVGL